MREYNSVSIVLKFGHIISSCVWFGAVVSIGVLLYLNHESGSSEELNAFNLGIHYLDNFLIGPSVAVSIMSGVFLCFSNNLQLFACRWVLKKWLGSLIAVAFGLIWLAPWLRQMEIICRINQFMVFTIPGYYRTYYLDHASLLVQEVMLLNLILISLLKPCAGHKNCVHCRERFAYKKA
ncbi:MAG: hypothetical protein P4L44_01685 [Oryzomonas sp.]|uniref:hypothetical protein n=1 Tax=Oryzomonas sp. TaxID=2855186 RepID=UPI00283DE610|nr:hypothetical protein [Oryzomonas sp.]MDR3578654.1 hypothetical protein [Oryzomonas sp.]